MPYLNTPKEFMFLSWYIYLNAKETICFLVFNFGHLEKCCPQRWNIYSLPVVLKLAMITYHCRVLSLGSRNIVGSYSPAKTTPGINVSLPVQAI